MKKIDVPQSLIGVLILITLVRPKPSLGNNLISGRLVDAVWLILALAIFVLSLDFDKRKPRLWGGIVWLIVMTLSINISLFIGALFLQQTIVFRDIFELYRGPYYILILLLASRLPWTEHQLREYFYKPFLFGIWIVLIVSFVSGLGGLASHLINIVYSPKYPGYDVLDLVSANADLRLRISGTFGNPNFYAVALAIMVPFLFTGYYMIRQTYLRFVISITIVLSFIFLFSTGSRVGWISGIISIISYFFWDIRSQKKRVRIGVNRTKKAGKYLVIVAILLFAIIIFVGPKLERYTKTLREIENKGISKISSFERKIISGSQYVLLALNKSPILGFGPSKNIDFYQGDNQYSKIFFRYGLIGMVWWWGFWISIFVMAFKMAKRSKSLMQLALNNALLSIVPAFLVACIGGDFFDATQISTILLLFIGVVYSSNISVSNK